MKQPFAKAVPSAGSETAAPRRPRAFTPDEASVPATIEPLTDLPPEAEAIAEPPRLTSWPARVAWGAGGLLVTLALGLALERLVADLFATQPWLGWVAVALVAALAVALVALVIRETGSVWRLRTLDRVRHRAVAALASDRNKDGAAVGRELIEIYARRSDLARAREEFEGNSRQVFDGAEQVRLAERMLMAPLDAKARALTAASARRVALVTTVSPRALVDIAFVIFESVRLGSSVARLYGAKPGLLGTWRLIGAILAHLAVTGGLVLTDGVMEQLVGQGLAAKLSARLGEGVVNGLMTVRVGIAAIRVVRPLPFEVSPQPVVKDFIPELANVVSEKK